MTAKNSDRRISRVPVTTLPAVPIGSHSHRLAVAGAAISAINKVAYGPFRLTATFTLVAVLRATLTVVVASGPLGTAVRSCQSGTQAAQTERSPQGTDEDCFESLSTRCTASQVSGQLVKMT
ncbi:MAG TPA: hypothetical protein VN729_01290 [Ktedonobacteraceae bacterium]|nr:hypothetical protein [Ktedonobacteraceae bacterium]